MLRSIAHLKREGNMDKHLTPVRIVQDLFTLHNRSEGKSPRTIEWYSSNLKQLMKPKGPFDPNTPIGDITELELRTFIASIGERTVPGGKPLSPASFNNYVRVILRFFKWAYHEGFTETWLLATMSAPKVPLKLIETLTDVEIDILIDEVSNHPGEHALFALMLDTGLRSSEACSVSLDDVDLESGVVRVISGKGGKSRMVPFGTTVQKLILGWVMYHRPDTTDSHLFIDPKGRPYNRQSVRTLMRRLARRTGVARLHAHLLRHTFATRFLEAGGNALYLKMNLGHTTMAMTDRYVHLVGQRAAAATRQFSPFDKYRDGRRKRK